MSTLKSYDLNGKKLSFANWISNLSPQETPFVSMTGKESINQTMFQWQTDHLKKAGKNAVLEGDAAVSEDLETTTVKSNITQILRKTVKVSDTANALSNYGRGKELQYQMEKAGKEIKRDLEWVFLNNESSMKETPTTGRITAGFRGLVAALNQPDKDTGAIVHRQTASDDALVEKDIFDMTYNLYVAGSSANIIMFHPKWAATFSALQEGSGATPTRERIFQNTPKFSVYVSTLVDPLGQEYKLIPNRWMPHDQVYFFNASDWTQMVLRAPNRTKLAKDGSYEKWMLEMEVGLRHRNPYASGVLDIDHSDTPAASGFTTAKVKYNEASVAGGDKELEFKNGPVHVDIKAGGKLSFSMKSSVPAAEARAAASTDQMFLIHNGNVEGYWTGNGTSADKDYLMTSKAEPKHNGTYYLEYRDQKGVVYSRSYPVRVTVKSV